MDENGEVVARAGMGGYADFVNDQHRGASRIVAVHPNLTKINSYDLFPGSDTIFGGASRDVIVGCGGDRDELHGNDGSDFILGDFGELTFNQSSPNLYGIRSIESLNCAEGEGGGINDIYGNHGDGKFR